MGRALGCEMGGPGFEPSHIIKLFFFDFLGFCLSFFFVHVIAVTLGTALFIIARNKYNLSLI